MRRPCKAYYRADVERAGCLAGVQSVRVSGVEDRVVEPFRTTYDHPVTCTRRSFPAFGTSSRPVLGRAPGRSVTFEEACREGRALGRREMRGATWSRSRRQMPASRHKRARVDAASRRSLLVPKRDPARARRGCPHLSDSGSRRLPIDRCGARRVGLRGSPSVSWTRAAAGTLRRRRLRHVAHRAIR